MPKQPVSTPQIEQDDDFGGMELKTKGPPTEAKIRKKLESLLADCVEYGYKIDIDSIMKGIKDEKLQESKYKLRIEYGYSNKVQSISADTVLGKLDIYLSDDEEDILDLSAIEKATYLAFLLYEDGLVLENIKMDFVNTMKAIYDKLPDTVRDYTNGSIMNDDFSISTLRGYISGIRDAIKDRIKNRHLIEKFAIDGYKNEEFKIEMSTPEIREQIKKVFYLE